MASSQISKTMKRILVTGLTSEYGGMEVYIMNLYRNVDRKLLQFDFVNHLKNEKLAFDDEIKSLGGNIYYIPMLRDDYFGHYKKIKDLMISNNYEALYHQANKKIKNMDYFKYAKKFGVPKRIIHSHNSHASFDSNKLDDLREKLSFRQYNKYLTNKFACSEGAGLYMFGDNSPFTVIRNGIDTERYKFNEERRMQTRNKLHFTDSTVVYGTVGRLSDQKNPFFLVDIFAKIHEKEPEAVFIHIGGGELYDQVNSYIERCGLSDCYFLLGRKIEVQDYLCAMDCFLFPSKYEGFSIVLVEAQASGLQCIVSDNVPTEVNLTGQVYYLSLERDSDFWAEYAIKMTKKRNYNGYLLIDKNGYDIKNIAKKFEHFVLGVSDELLYK